jgi:hypothetical protein
MSAYGTKRITASALRDGEHRRGCTKAAQGKPLREENFV